MNKIQFLKISDVNDFVSWLAGNLPTLPICLRIGKSPFVPNGVNANITGFGNVLNHYVWKSTGMKIGDWTETKAHLTGLSKDLITAVSAGNHVNTLDECDKILAWGGDRNPSVGATPFLHGMAPGTLCSYINNAGSALSLVNADEATLSPPVTLMNAMLTKVHALYATDGLPIYDSRVAAAIASLVELWRQSTGKYGSALPPALAFPATLTTRTVLRVFPNAIHPGVMVYGAPATPQQWSSAKVRLGWIMEEVLTKSPNLTLAGQHASLADRMHAFEASLFMIGYDVVCLNPSTTTSGIGSSSTIVPAYAKAIRTLRKGLTARFASMPKMVCQTLVKKNNFNYSGSMSAGFVIWYQRSGPVILETGFIEEIQNVFGGGNPVPFGFDREGKNVPTDSFGRWISTQSPQFGRQLSGQNASHIAALLVKEGLAERINNTLRIF